MIRFKFADSNSVYIASVSFSAEGIRMHKTKNRELSRSTYQQRYGPLSFLNLPVQLNFMLWHPTIGDCARLVWPKLFLLPLEIRAANSFQLHSRGLNIHTYLSPASNREGSILSKLATHFARRSRNSPTVEMIYRHFYELHWSLHTRDFPRFSSYAVTCALMHSSPSVVFKPYTLLFSPFVYPICIDLLAKKRKFKIELFIYSIRITQSASR